MPIPANQIKHHFVHIIEGTTPTPFGIVIAQIEQPTLPLIPPRPTTGRQLDGGRATDNMVTFVEDEGTPFDPVPFSFVWTVLPDQLETLKALGNPFGDSGTITVGGDTWVGQGIAAIGNRIDSEGNAVAALYPQDTQQQNRMFRIVSEHQVPADAVAANSLIMDLNGCVVDTVEEAPAGNGLYVANVSGMIWGAMNRVTVVPTYTASTPGAYT